MANTTNFGWETPDDTDLVKDGAAAIRTLAGAIDTSLVDLKGGTTNQVLAKNSNTDMDFKWVADASGIPATIFDAKGDLIVASAADTAARLAVGGTNGHVLTVNSGATNGIEWAALPAAGSFVGCQLAFTGSQSIPNTTATALTWGVENFDTDGMHSTVTNTSRITIASGKDGYYWIYGFVSWDLGTHRRIAYIYKNGAEIIGYEVGVTSSSPSTYPAVGISTVLNLVAGDYLELFAYQNTGGNLNANAFNQFGAYKIG